MQNLLRAVICTLNSQYIHSSLAPWCLLAGVREYCGDGIAACVIEGTINEDIKLAAKRIIDATPDLVGLSCYIWNISQTHMLIALIKSALPECIIVVGGPEVSYCAEQVLTDDLLIDYVISGEGELPFASLLNAISQSDSIPAELGICHRKIGELSIAEPYVSRSDPPSPYTEDFFSALGGRIAYLETSRGCPFSCAFCLSGRCGGVRFFDIDRAKNELLLLAGSGARTIKLVDRTFNANRKRAAELYRFIIENYGSSIPSGVCFHFEIAGDILDEDTLALLAGAPVGAIQLEIGLQSFNPLTLDAIHRKTDIEKLKSNIRKLLLHNNIHIHIDLIAGLPHEDIISFEQSFNIAYNLKPHMLQLGFLKLLHGADMREQPLDFPCEFSQIPPYEVISTPWICAAELHRLHLIEDALDRIGNSGRFRRTAEYLLFSTGYSPFRLFDEFGSRVSEESERISLDCYTMLIFDFFNHTTGVDPSVLRDMLICDRLSTNSSGLIPLGLRIKDDRLKKARAALELDSTTKRPHGARRGLELLYSESCIVYADYDCARPVIGEYILHKIPLSQLFLF